DIAAKLRTSPAVLSRSFKADFTQPPAFYRRGLRVTVGMYELMMGARPAEAALLAGYTDLGRFYKQFRQYLKQTPAEYLQKSKNAKKLMTE
ncbi:MAG: helix-turn-helix domain-containing protein, partial [Nitrospira sp.]|nr:helix-turn-helix domain-containing protein [Nitrospira sp.]